MRGEKLSLGSVLLVIKGSPPLARGKGVYGCLYRLQQGITPACAGKRYQGLCPAVLFYGSPPLARGKAAHIDARDIIPGITPACAGKSCTAAYWNVRSRDHPRLRGEKRLAKAGIFDKQGSPPLARGKAAAAEAPRSITGITPACAGKRTLEAFDILLEEDHPRLRGEKRKSSTDSSLVSGSPPLARGKDFETYLEHRAERITPACAGKRHSPCHAATGSRDHPRLRGEK